MARILIVDDSRTSRRMLTNILEKFGHEVVGEAKNGEEGVEKYKELRPDIVTLDITMPKLDGISTLEQLLAFDKDAHVVMVTANDNTSVVRKAIALGAKNFSVKPLKPETVLSRIKSSVRK